MLGIVKADPYHDLRKVHMAKLVSDKGGISPLCVKRPRKLNLKREGWTLTKRFVTCEKCKAALKRPGPRRGMEGVSGK